MSLLPFRVELDVTLLDEEDGAEPLHTHLKFTGPTNPQPHYELLIMALLTASSALLDKVLDIREREDMPRDRLDALTDYVCRIPTTCVTQFNPGGKSE